MLLTRATSPTRTPFLRRWHHPEVPKLEGPLLRFQASFWIRAVRRMFRSPSEGSFALCKSLFFKSFLFRPVSFVIQTSHSMLILQYVRFEAHKLIFFALTKMDLTLSLMSWKGVFFLLPSAFAVVTMSALSKPAHGDILGKGNRKIMSCRNSKATI